MRNILTPVSILLAGALVGLAIAFTFRFEVAAFGGETYRLDRWTGVVVSCHAPNQSRLAGDQLGVGVTYRCTELTSGEIQKLSVDKNAR